ncbi:MAG: histidinol phosphate phosphatase [Coxiella sp. RIFCSPHIGHO2_12_FULL_42_15]|nr:MAG: histidinol phosphate phosphatase [Coxiella sp. RIFCSPHIGHO2_12_FULL_42_15]
MITSKARHPAVFLDRDGVITIPEFREGRSFAPRSLAQLAYFPDVPFALQQLKEQGFLLIVVTNQPDVGNGLVQQSVIEAMHQKMKNDLPIDDIQVCYHTRQDRCDCRKPQIGLFTRAMANFPIDINQSYMIGDRSIDIEAGQRMGCKTIFVDYDYVEPMAVIPDVTVRNLSEAIRFIL